MEQIVLRIKDDSKIDFLKEILKRMEFVEITEPGKFTVNEEEFIAGFKDSVE